MLATYTCLGESVRKINVHWYVGVGVSLGPKVIMIRGHD
jgi:hypothetical protein